MLDSIIYKIETSKKIEDVICNIEKSCADNQFSLLNTYAYHEVVKSKGFPIKREVYVYEICNAKVAALVLEAEPIFAPFMPCRIAVYEQNNKTIISTQNMEIMLTSFDTNSEFYQETSTLFSKLKLVIEQLKG